MTAPLSKIDPAKLAALRDRIAFSRKILLASHTSPDGDTLGSALALYEALRAAGKTCRLYCENPVPYNYRFLPLSAAYTTSLSDLGDFDLAVIIDAGEPERVSQAFAGALAANTRVALAVIDHHETSADGPLTLLDVSASATGEIVYYFLRKLELPITLAMAENLYAAIFTDTGSFRYSCTTPSALRICAELIEIGVKPWEIASMIYEREPRARLLILAEALRTLTISSCGRYAYIMITREDYRKTGANYEMTDQLVNFPRALDGVEVAAFFRETEEGKYKVSFRSRGLVNVAQMAARFQGGGHQNAAGCTVDGPFPHARKMIIDAVETELDKQKIAHRVVP
jgi:phosphoesterase RecJ-like protein